MTTPAPPDSPRSEWGDMVVGLIKEGGYPSVAAFCRKIGVGESLFFSYLRPYDSSKRVVPTPERVREIADALGVTQLPAPPPKQTGPSRLELLEQRVSQMEQQLGPLQDLLESLRSDFEQQRSQREEPPPSGSR